MKQCSLLIRDALIVCSYGQRSYIGWLAVSGSRILALGGGAPPEFAADEVVDGSRMAVLPGLINAHAHSHGSLTRGTAEGLPLDPWLRAIQAELAIMSDDDAEVAALACYAEALLSGTTTIVDMCVRTRPARKAAGAIGIRQILVPFTGDRLSSGEPLQAAADLLAEGSNDHPHLGVWVGLHDLETCSDGQIREGIALARRYGTGLHMHCAETDGNSARTRARTGRSPVAQLAELGALSERTLLAHCVWTDPSDAAMLARTRTAVAHCPQSNMKLASGIAPVPMQRSSGITVCLGSDGVKSSHTFDLFDAMKFASLLHKVSARDATVLPATEIIDMATRAGGQALGIDAGSLEAGKLADIVLVNMDRYHLQPRIPGIAESNLVHAARGSDVDTVIVGGRVVVRGGRLLTIDAGSLLQRQRTAGAALLSRAAA